MNTEPEHHTLMQEIGNFFTRFGGYFFSVLFGLMGRYGMEIAMKKRYTKLQWLGIGFVSIFSGYISSVMCEVYGWTQAQHFMPSVATLFGYNGAMYVIYNYKKIGDIIVEVLTRKDKK